MYDELLTGLPLELPLEASYARHVWYNYVVQIEESRRDDFLRHLTQHGVPAFVMYPTLVPLQPAYRDDLGYSESDFPVGAPLTRRIVNLPIFAHMTDEEVRQVATTVKTYFK